jgi:tetratricopeptide (TPR) repeat protein
MAVGEGGARADTFLDEQTRLTRLQITQIEEENTTRRRLLRIEHASALFKLALEIAAAAVAAVIVIGLGVAMWNAAHDNGLVVQPFSVPPDLAGRGLTGEVVAAKLLDKLSNLQSATISNRASSSYANNWGDDIKLQIPDTGVSIGEFNRTLHAWLGHQTRITGEIWRTPTGLAVTARAGNDTSPTFTGTDAELDTLIRKAAESVYRATQPYRYAVYLANVNRTKEAQAAYEALIANGTPQDRAWAYIGLENIYTNLADYPRAVRTLRNALAIRHDFIMSYINWAGLEGQRQHDEVALALQTKLVAIARGPRATDMSEIAWTMAALSGEGTLAADLGDFQGQLDANRKVEALPDFNGQIENARQNDVVTHGFLHDGAGAREAFEILPPNSNALVKLQRDANRSFADLLLGKRETILRAQPEFEDFLAKLGPPGIDAKKRQFWPIMAFALAQDGDFKGAHALVDKTPADCILCLRMRGAIDGLEKNWSGSEYWYARATHDAPTPPLAWCDWGHMLLVKGDYAGAIAKLKIAHDKGPRYADPLEYWGEALIGQGRSDLALAKFEEANKYAPNWGRLHLKWGEALTYLNRKNEAAKQFALARSLDD